MDDMPRSPVFIFGAPRTPTALLERSRLLALLDGPEALVVVRAPAGYGKTALLAQWARSPRVPGVWLAVETGESDAPAFASLLVRSLSDAGLVRPGSVLATAEAAIDSGEEPWAILRRGLAQLGGELVLVIDNSDRLADDVLQQLVHLLAATPRVRARVATRRISPLVSSAAALVLDTTVIEASALRMTDDEVEAALRVAGVDADPTPFVRAAGGVPLAVRALILHADAVGTDTPSVGFNRAVDAIDNYLTVSQDSEPVDPRYTRFLARTSVAEVLTTELAVALTGEDAVDDLFTRAESGGLGMWSDDGRIFTYTTMVRELLRRSLDRTTPEDRPGLQRIVAQWSARNQRPLSAVALAVEIGDFALASDVMRGSWSALLLSHGGKLRPLFAGVPVTALRRYPIITMMLALSYNAASLHRVKAVELFALSIMASRIQRRRASPPDRALLSGMESAAFRVIGQFDQALTAARDAVAFLNRLSLSDRESLGTIVPALYSHAGVSLFYAGHENEALAAFRASVAIGDSLSAVSGLSGLSNTAGALALAGDLDDARAICADARRRDWPDGWLTGYLASFYHLAEALIALESGDTDEASRRIGLLDKHRDTIEHWPLLADVDAMIAILRGAPADGLAQLDVSVRRHSNRASSAAPITRRIAATRSLLELASGHVAAAEKLVAPLAPKDPRAAVAMARIALVRDEPTVALRRLEAAFTTWPRLSTRHRAEAGAVEAAALLREGRRTDAVTSFERLRGLLSTSGLRLALALLPDRDVRALRSLTVDRHDLLDVLDGITGLIPEAVGRPALTEREAVVLQALARNGSVADIAADLFVSPNTVKSQLKALYRKLGVSNRDDAIAAGRAHGHTLSGST